MARLPTPGGDAGQWGTILNAFLGVGHTDGGELKIKTWANAAARPASPEEGQCGINLATGQIERYASGAWTESTIQADASNRIKVVDAALAALVSAETVVYRTTGGAYAKAKADASATAEAVGVVESVDAGTDTVTIVLSGKITLTGKSVGVPYYLSDATAGALTAIAPTATTSYHVPILHTESATVGYVNIDAPVSLAPTSGSLSVVSVSGTINGSNVTFTLPSTPTTGILLLLLGRQPQIEDVDYTLSGTTITYTTAPGSTLSGQPHKAIIY